MFWLKSQDTTELEFDINITFQIQLEISELKKNQLTLIVQQISKSHDKVQPLLAKLSILTRT